MKNYHVICNAEGKIVSYGHGTPIEMHESWTIEWFDTEDEMEAHDCVQRDRTLVAAIKSLQPILDIDRTQAKIAKATQAAAFLIENPEPTMAKDDVGVIDQALYPDLYYEYWNTFDQVVWTPHELAELICEKAKNASSEGELRRAKLIAEKAILENQ